MHGETVVLTNRIHVNSETRILPLGFYIKERNGAIGLYTLDSRWPMRVYDATVKGQQILDDIERHIHGSANCFKSFSGGM